MNTNAANFAGTQLAGCRCGWLLTYTAALSKDSRHHAASTSTGFASDFRRTRRHPNQPRNFSALRRYVGRIRSSLQSRCQPIHKLLRPAAFVQRTGKTTSAGLRSVRLRGKRSRLWCRRLGLNQRREPDICLAPLYPTELRLRSSPARTAREMPGSLQRIDRHSSCLRGGAYINLKGPLSRWGGVSPSAILSMRPVSRELLKVF